MTEALPVGHKELSEDQVTQTIRDVIIELAPEPDGAAGPGSLLIEDLGYHSLALLELAFTLEDEFDLQPINEEIAREINTIDDVERHVITELKERRAEAG